MTQKLSVVKMTLKHCFSVCFQCLAPTERLVRMVCLKYRLKEAKPRSLASRFPSLSSLAPLFGFLGPTAITLSTVLLAALFVSLPPTPIRADTWKPLDQESRWKPRESSFEATSLDRFPSPGRDAPLRNLSVPSAGTKLDRLLSVIGAAEAPRGYNSIHYSADRLPGKKPVAMTLGEIRKWIDATPGQHHAIGQFQIIPDTLARLARQLNLPASTRFDRRTQNLMARVLVDEAGYSKFVRGEIDRETFMDNLALVWAGLPLRSGKSAYHNYAGNQATITRGQFRSAMARIFG